MDLKIRPNREPEKGLDPSFLVQPEKELDPSFLVQLRLDQ